MDQMNLDTFTGRATNDMGGISAQMAQQLHATLGTGAAPCQGDLMPQLWHWCAFPPVTPNDLLGADGHPRGSDLLPPLRGQRRMWAGGAFHFHAPVRIGDTLRRRSTVRQITQKEGAAGPMMFVTVDHAIFGPGGLVIEEQQDIVYLDIPQEFSPPKKRALPAPELASLATPETVLFRYSALTFNAHRIHYDLAYTTQVEKYPGLVVHGPLQATWLMQAATRHKGRPPSYFSFRGVHPMFAGAPCQVALQEEDGALNLWTGQDGHQCMSATALWEDTA